MQGLASRRELASWMRRYGLAVGCVALVAAVKLALDPWLQAESPFLLMALAVMVSAWYGGLWPGLFATALAALVAVYLFLAPTGTLRVQDVGQAVRLGLFVTEGVAISAFAAALQRARRDAEEALRARDQFISVAAHELKTPLTALLGYAQVLQRRTQREGTLSGRDQHALRVVVDQSTRLHKLIDALLDVSRIRLDRLSLDRAPLDLRALAQRLVDEMQPSLDHHDLRVTATDGPLMVEGDELRLEQVVQNLLQNAVKYSPDGGSIVVQVGRRDGHALLAVTDPGIGIPEEAKGQLFQRFFRAGNVAGRQIGGMGIGLYVVKEIVTLHGGTVEVASQAGQGSTFTVRLPLLGSPRAAPSVAQAASESAMSG